MGASYQQYIRTTKKTFTVVAEAFSDPMAHKNGATRAIGKMEWSFVDIPQATSLFVDLLRNASVQWLSLAIPLSHRIIQVRCLERGSKSLLKKFGPSFQVGIAFWQSKRDFLQKMAEGFVEKTFDMPYFSY